MTVKYFSSWDPFTIYEVGTADEEIYGSPRDERFVLAADYDAAERDAKRYRWLKEHCVKYYDPPGFLLEWARDSKDVDASIDAEIAADSASGFEAVESAVDELRGK
jgi:hypothetical protein